MLVDRLSNVLCMISNGWSRGLNEIRVPDTKLVRLCLEVLMQNGCIGKFESLGKNAYDAGFSLKVKLLYTNGLPPYKKFAKISKCSLRRYTGVDALSLMVNRYPHYLFVVSTNKGVMNGAEAAKMKIGGELLFKVMP